jgi:hypothetical protein
VRGGKPKEGYEAGRLRFSRKKWRAEARPRLKEESSFQKAQPFNRDKLDLNFQSQRPKPADCMDCRERSAVDAMPCMRNLNSSALEALSRAVS